MPVVEVTCAPLGGSGSETRGLGTERPTPGLRVAVPFSFIFVENLLSARGDCGAACHGVPERAVSLPRGLGPPTRVLPEQKARRAGWPSLLPPQTHAPRPGQESAPEALSSLHARGPGDGAELTDSPFPIVPEF